MGDKATITAQDLKIELDQGHRYQIVDVRSAAEYAAGHIPGALNIPMEQAEARLEDIAGSDPVVLACQSGDRASMTCEILASHMQGLIVLEGGTEAWEGAGLPTVCTTSTRWSLDRQVRLGAGILVLTGVILSLTVNPYWLILSGFVGAGLTFAGLTNVCGMAAVLGLMPWNKPRVSSGTTQRLA